MIRLPDRLDTDRLRLRRWEPDDVDQLIAAVLASRDHLLPWMPWAAGEPVGRDTRLTWIRAGNDEWAKGGDVVLGMFADGAVVGGTGLHRRRGPDTLEVGYWVHVDHVGRGFASEAVAALTTAALALSGIEYVEIRHDRANTASRRVPERLGFHFIDEQQDTPQAPGEEGIDCCWRVDRAEWSERQAQAGRWGYSPR